MWLSVNLFILDIFPPFYTFCTLSIATKSLLHSRSNFRLGSTEQEIARLSGSNERAAATLDTQNSIAYIIIAKYYINTMYVRISSIGLSKTHDKQLRIHFFHTSRLRTDFLNIISLDFKLFLHFIILKIPLYFLYITIMNSTKYK